MRLSRHMDEIATAVSPRDCESEDDQITPSSNDSAADPLALFYTPAHTSQSLAPSASDSIQQRDILTALIREAFEGKRYASLDDFDILAMIGRENFAKIFLVKAKVSQILYALKSTRKDFIVENEEAGHIKEEKHALLTAAKERHPFIVQVKSAFQTDTRIYTILEHLGGGDLMHHIQKGTHILNY